MLCERAYTTGLTSSEKKAVEELQMRMKSELSSGMFEGIEDDTTVFYRFVKARNFDVDKAEIMLRKHLIWRKTFQINRILEDLKPKEFFLKYIVLTFIGLDKEGNFVKYFQLGKLDAREVLKCMKLNDYMKHWTWLTESNAALAKKLKEETGRELIQMTLILDMNKLTFRNVTYKESIDITLRYIRLICDNYPECLKAVHVINAPSYFVIIFSIVKAMISQELIQKINIFGYDGWKERLLEVIDADVLPAFLGGNRTDPDGNPLCTTLVNHWDKISEIYYLPDKARWFKDRTKVKKILVPAKGKKEIFVDVTESGSFIEWEFAVHNKGIGFGLFYKNEEDEVQEVLPIHAFETVDGTEVGSFRTQSEGIYVIIFENSDSWLSSKEVEYCIKVVKPGF